jgi:20S proteasome alpha/beta subunit
MLQPGSSEELGYHPFWEDTPMTLQVALVGSDGIVLASDKKTVVMNNIMTTGVTSKILVDDSSGIAIAYAGHEISQYIARRILREPSVLESKGSHLIEVEKLAETVYKEQEEQITEDNRHSRIDSWLFMVQRKDLSRFHVLHMDRTKSLSEPRYNMGIIGHATNTACFFAERYYRKAPVDALKLLAAHTILTAGRINPLGIEDLEMLVCTPEKFGSVTLQEISALKNTEAPSGCNPMRASDAENHKPSGRRT